MAHYENQEIGVSFDLPDDPSALQIIRYDSERIERSGEPAILILWECVKPLITNWACDALPNLTTPLDNVKSLQAAQAVEWSAFRGVEWRNGLDTVSKNS